MVEAELTKEREELNNVQLLKQEVVRDTAATQKQLDGVTSSLHPDCIITYRLLIMTETLLSVIRS